jgi:hypothetical protein
MEKKSLETLREAFGEDFDEFVDAEYNATSPG